MTLISERASQIGSWKKRNEKEKSEGGVRVFLRTPRGVEVLRHIHRTRKKRKEEIGREDAGIVDLRRLPRILRPIRRDALDRGLGHQLKRGEGHANDDNSQSQCLPDQKVKRVVMEGIARKNVSVVLRPQRNLLNRGHHLRFADEDYPHLSPDGGHHLPFEDLHNHDGINAVPPPRVGNEVLVHTANANSWPANKTD